MAEDLDKELEQLKKAAAASDKRTDKLHREIEEIKQTNGELLKKAAEVERRLAEAG